jgi:N6-L-threonylcarbamoyladenine synthase
MFVSENFNTMNILSIETSCDETSIAIVRFDGDQYEVLSHITRTQIEIHKEYGGVYPTLAKREHARNLTPIFELTLKESNLLNETPTDIGDKKKELEELLIREPEAFDALTQLLSQIEKPNIDAITVTQGPGLEPALWVGINFAKALGMVWDIPVIPSNHMEGHLVSVLVDEHKGALAYDKLHLPALALLISGNHTELVHMKEIGSYTKLGQTRDDAIGEAFDKVARMMDLPYPGGPKISKLAEKGQENENIKLPRPMINSGDYDFSFSGIKTAVLYLLKNMDEVTDQIKADTSREFQNAVTEVLVAKTRRAVEEYSIKTLIIGGGVAANKQIRETFADLLEREYSDVNLLLPAREVTGDNALMMAVAGYLNSRFFCGWQPLAVIGKRP